MSTMAKTNAITPTKAKSESAAFHRGKAANRTRKPR